MLETKGRKVFNIDLKLTKYGFTDIFHNLENHPKFFKLRSAFNHNEIALLPLPALCMGFESFSKLRPETY